MKILPPLAFLLSLLFITPSAHGQDTFSIVAVDSLTGEVGSAGASCVDLTNFPGFATDFLGELFPAVGAINTQAYYLEANQQTARNRMQQGDTPGELIEWLITHDINNQPQFRQYGVAALVGGSPQAAAYTGSATDNYKNHRTGPHYAIQGNILLGPAVLEDMETNFLQADGDLACKLMAALQGAKRVGADSRCAGNGTSALFAFVKVAQPGDTFGNPSFVLGVRTANGDRIEPIDSLQTLFDLARSCLALNVTDPAVFSAHFAVYPNPVTTAFTIDNKNLGACTLEVVGITGQVLYQARLVDRLTLPTADWAKGTYFLRIVHERQQFVTQIIKG